jgi:hypothetical protein
VIGKTYARKLLIGAAILAGSIGFDVSANANVSADAHETAAAAVTPTSTESATATKTALPGDVFANMQATAVPTSKANGSGTSSDAHDAHRLHDAIRLNACNEQLIQGSEALKDAVNLIAQSSPLRADVTKDQFESYRQLLTAYHDALNAYMQHRMEVQQHASQFHQTAQLDKMIDTPIQVKPFTPLKVQAVDQCALLQLREKQLTALELQLRDAIQSLLNQRGQLTPDQLQTQALSLQSGAIEDQNAAIAFDKEVNQKEITASKQIQETVHAALNNGDYVQSTQVYGEEQRRNALIQGELQRAQMHINIARAFTGKLGLLSAQQTENTGQAPVNFADADIELAAEYQKVQQLYGQLQRVRPQ